MKGLDAVLNNSPGKRPVFRNYFWAGTFAVVLACALLFLLGGNNWNPIVYDRSHRWSDGLYFAPLFYGFLQSFGHSNLQHMLLNMLCFLIVGLYLERRTGTLKLLLLVIAFAFLSTGITAANSGGVGSIGYSGVNFAFYFYIIVEFISLAARKETRNKQNMILGALILALIYLAMCFNGGTTSFGFEWYPYDLLHNMGHTGGAFAGIVVGLIVQVAKLQTEKKNSASCGK